MWDLQWGPLNVEMIKTIETKKLHFKEFVLSLFIWIKRIVYALGNQYVKNYICFYIGYFFCNILVLNYLLIYVVLLLFLKVETNVSGKEDYPYTSFRFYMYKKSVQETPPFFSVFFICFFYAILSLLFYVLEFFFFVEYPETHSNEKEDRSNKEKGTRKRKSAVNIEELMYSRENNKQKRNRKVVDFIFLYIVVIVLGTVIYTGKKTLFSLFLFLLIICEINKPLYICAFLLKKIIYQFEIKYLHTKASREIFVNNKFPEKRNEDNTYITNEVTSDTDNNDNNNNNNNNRKKKTKKEITKIELYLFVCYLFLSKYTHFFFNNEQTNTYHVKNKKCTYEKRKFKKECFQDYYYYCYNKKNVNSCHISIYFFKKWIQTKLSFLTYVAKKIKRIVRDEDKLPIQEKERSKDLEVERKRSNDNNHIMNKFSFFSFFTAIFQYWYSGTEKPKLEKKYSYEKLESKRRKHITKNTGKKEKTRNKENIEKTKKNMHNEEITTNENHLEPCQQISPSKEKIYYARKKKKQENENDEEREKKKENEKENENENKNKNKNESKNEKTTNIKESKDYIFERKQVPNKPNKNVDEKEEEKKIKKNVNTSKYYSSNNVKKKNDDEKRFLTSSNQICSGNSLRTTEKEDEEKKEEKPYMFELSKKEFLKLKENVNKYNNYYCMYFKKYKPTTIKQKTFPFVEKKRKRQFRVIEDGGNKFVFDESENENIKIEEAKRTYKIEVQEEGCHLVEEITDTTEIERSQKIKETTGETIEKHTSQKHVKEKEIKEPIEEPIEEPIKERNSEEYTDDEEMKEFSIEENEKEFFSLNKCTSSINTVEESNNQFDENIYNFEIEKKKNDSEDIITSLCVLGSLKLYNKRLRTTNRNDRATREKKKIKIERKCIKEKKCEIRKGKNNRNKCCRMEVAHKSNPRSTEVFHIEKKIKKMLASYHNKNEIYVFLNSTYKLIILINILLIFFVKGIVMSVHMYYFFLNYKNDFLIKTLLSLIQCSFIYSFHLNLHEYRKLK